jgi:6-phosphogluconolactonase
MMSKHLVFVETYTQPIKFGTGQVLEGKGKGIYSFLLDMETGALREEKLGLGIVNPSYLTLNRAANRLYAVNELKEYEGRPSGAVSAFSFDPQTRELKLLNTRATGGTDPCHVTLDQENAHVFVSNFMSGSVCVFPLEEDGSLGEASQFIQHEGSSVNKTRQSGPHAHSLIFDISGRFAFVPDLGIDRLMAYQTTSGTLTPAPVPFYRTAPGSGPRHCAFHQNGRYAYLINELGSSISALAYDKTEGFLRHLQTVPAVVEEFNGENSCADIQILPNGSFLYGSNRGHDSIIVYRIDPDTGLLSYVGFENSGGKIPRSFCIDPAGTFLLAANQDTDNIVVFRIDSATGKLKKVSEQFVPTPVCVKSYRL